MLCAAENCPEPAWGPHKLCATHYLKEVAGANVGTQPRTAPAVTPPRPRPRVCVGCGKKFEQMHIGRERKWCSDRCRKIHTYGQACPMCGGYMDGSSGVKKNSRHCKSCAGKAAQKWTREAIIAKIHEWNDTYGSRPTATDWNTAQSKTYDHLEKVERYYEKGAGYWPSVSGVQERFGTWNAAIEAAGFASQPSGKYGRPGEDLELCKEILARLETGESTRALGAEYGCSSHAILYRARKARNALGVPPPETPGAGRCLRCDNPLRSSAALCGLCEEELEAETGTPAAGRRVPAEA